MALSLSALSLFFYLMKQNNGAVPNGLGWLPLFSLIVFVVSYSFGLGPIAYLLLGELVPPHIKGRSTELSELLNVRWRNEVRNRQDTFYRISNHALIATKKC